MVIVEGLCKTYRGGVRALDNVSFRCNVGTFGLLGHNGAGKTTLMRILGSLVQADAGRASVFGVPVERAEEIRAMLGYLPQRFGFYPQLTVRETLEFFAVLKKVASRARIDEVIEVAGLGDLVGRRAGSLSGGMRQRLGIAVALLNDPRLLIVDEPTAGLDPVARADFRQMLSALPGKRVVILSTHIVEDVTLAASRLAVLHRGRLLFAGTTSELASAAEGHAWEARVPTTEIERLRATHAITSAVRDGDTVFVRCVGEPLPGLSPRPATTEDGLILLTRAAESAPRVDP
ncbi:MAG: ATP-binding cassette domain-containing protein [Chloroflexi bacterium]|nr:ATP-binding cassette domain-containing protein [Chloroflexota bacterium]